MTSFLLVLVVVAAVLMLARRTGTGPRRELEDLEARLLPPPDGGPGHGHFERERYEDGETEMEIWVRGLELTEDAELEVSVADRPVAALPVRAGRARYEVRGPDGEIPAAAAGETVRVRHRGRVILEGRLRHAHVAAHLEMKALLTPEQIAFLDSKPTEQCRRFFPILTQPNSSSRLQFPQAAQASISVLSHNQGIM